MKCGKILPKEEESKTKCESSDNMSKDIHNIITEERIKKEAEKLMNTLPCDEAEKITERIKDFREFTNTKVSKEDLHKAEVIYKD